MRTEVLLALLLAWPALAGVRGGDLALSLPEGGGEGPLTVLASGPDVTANVALELRGADGQPLAGRWRRAGDEVLWPADQPRVRVTLRAERGFAQLAATPSAGPDLRLTVRWPVALAASWRAWDGRGERPGRAAEWAGTGPEAVPVVAAWDDRVGFGLALLGDPRPLQRAAVTVPNGRHGALSLDLLLTGTVTVCLSRFASQPFGVAPLLEHWRAVAPQAAAVTSDQGVWSALSRPAEAFREALHGPLTWSPRWADDDVGQDVVAAEHSPAELRGLLRARWDTALLWCWRFGRVPAGDLSVGYGPARRAAPWLADCVRAGWHPLTALTADAPVWLARYGQGLNTRIAVLNPHDERPVHANVRLHSAWTGVRGLLLARDDGLPTANRSDGGDTLLTVDLPPRSGRVFVAVGRTGGAVESVTVDTEPRAPQAGDALGVVPTGPWRLAATRAVYDRAGLLGCALSERD